MPPENLLRYLHANFCGPNDAVTDGELLRRCIANQDNSAFELLMRRHAELVWKVCRLVTRSHHNAEDAFQATFLALAHKAAAIGSGNIAGWLCRVAYNAALKARGRPMTELIDDPHAPLDESTDTSEFVQVLYEELNCLAECYRVPLILCYLQEYTHSAAAEQLGWPIGTVATRVARGRDRLRERLVRRGVVLSAGGLLAAFNLNPVSALLPALVPTTARAISSGSKLSTSVQLLSKEALSAMKRNTIWPVAAATFSLAAFVLFAFAGSPEPPINHDSLLNEQADEKGQGRDTEVPKPRVIPGPGIQSLATASTDIIIADVVDTNPHKAMEGARDTVKLKVVRTLLGHPEENETISVYYHLLWADEKGETLEAAKFTKGKRYLVFLDSHLTRSQAGERIEYQLTDQWLSVQPNHTNLVKEVAAAIRVTHGDTRGEWSSTDGVIAGLQGRMVAYRGEPYGKPNVVTIFLELRNTSGGNNTTEFLLDEASFEWKVTDPNGKPVESSSLPGNWQTSPRKLTLASKEAGRLPLTANRVAPTPDCAAHFDMGILTWEVSKGEKGVYTLATKITIAPTSINGKWSGTLNLPKVRIPLGD